MSAFVDSFWNTELGNYSGFEVLCRHLREGKQAIKEYVEFIKLRAQAQEAYGRTLVKLSRSSSEKDEKGILQTALNALRTQTEKVGLSHISMAMSIQEEAVRMAEFVDNQQEKRKQIEDRVRRQQVVLKGLHRKMLDNKKACESKRRETEQAISQYQLEIEQKLLTHTKDVEKLRHKQMKALQILDDSDQCFKSSVSIVEKSRAQWEVETQKSYQVFQALEEERIRNVRSSVWLFVNLISVLCVVEDDACESVRKILEKCDVNTEIKRIIAENQTGSSRPSCIDPENIYSEIGEILDSNHITNKTGKVNENHVHFQDSHKSSGASKEKFSAVGDGDYEQLVNNEDKKDLQYKGLKYRVLFDFNSKNPSELSLKSNELVKLINKQHSDWWEVETKDKRRGFFPSKYLEGL